MLPLSENNSICQSRATRGDVDRPTSSIIERGQVIKPAICVSGPARDWAISKNVKCHPIHEERSSYTMVAQTHPNTKLGRILPLSKVPPTTIITVQMQKRSW
jgi:hypothetical protein